MCENRPSVRATTSINLKRAFSQPPISSPWVVLTWCLCAILAVAVVVWVCCGQCTQRGQCSLAAIAGERPKGWLQICWQRNERDAHAK